MPRGCQPSKVGFPFKINVLGTLGPITNSFKEKRLCWERSLNWYFITNENMKAVFREPPALEQAMAETPLKAS